MNYTTRIDVSQTVGEIQMLLGAHGADAIMIRYRDREPVAVSFTLTLGAGRDLAYTLPINAAAMRASLVRQHRDGQLSGISAERANDARHACRVAWRIIRDWLAAQLSLVEAGQGALDQVMLPYLHLDAGQGRTVYDAYREQGPLALATGERS